MYVCRFERGAFSRGGIQKSPVLSGSVFSLSDTVSWLEGLMAALDSYNWVLGDELLSVNDLFAGMDVKMVSIQGKNLQLVLSASPGDMQMVSCLFGSLEFFVQKLALCGLEAAVSCFDHTLETVHSPREREEYDTAKCSLILHLLKFLGILVDHRHDNPASVCG